MDGNGKGWRLQFLRWLFTNSHEQRLLPEASGVLIVGQNADFPFC